MPRQKHYYGENHLHFLTRSTYRRTRLFDSEKVGVAHGPHSVIAYMPEYGTYAPPASQPTTITVTPTPKSVVPTAP